MIFTSKRTFQAWDYSPSHSFMLLRSYMRTDDGDDSDESKAFNIDIELGSVDYIEIPTIIKGLTLSILDKKEPVPVRLSAMLSDHHRQHILSIESNGNTYYILCWFAIVGENRWFDDSRITRPELNYDVVHFNSDWIKPS